MGTDPNNGKKFLNNPFYSTEYLDDPLDNLLHIEVKSDMPSNILSCIIKKIILLDFTMEEGDGRSVTPFPLELQSSSVICTAKMLELLCITLFRCSVAVRFRRLGWG